METSEAGSREWTGVTWKKKETREERFWRGIGSNNSSDPEKVCDSLCLCSCSSGNQEAGRGKKGVKEKRHEEEAV